MVSVERLLESYYDVRQWFMFILMFIMNRYRESCRQLETRHIYECRYDERLKTKGEESTRLAYTGLVVELEHLKILKIETRLIDEKFVNVMGEVPRLGED